MKLELEPAPAKLVANVAKATDFLKTFAHPSRLMIVCALVDGERSVRDLEDTLGTRQPARRSRSLNCGRQGSSSAVRN